MDPLTQGLLGAATAQLGFRQRIGRDATWVAAVAAVLPDLDVFIVPLMSLGGAELDGMASLRYHRALSHSLLLAPLLSLPIALGWAYLRRALRRRERPDVRHETTARPSPPFALLYACVFTAVFTHPLLDWTTCYGTQLLAPLTHRRYALDAAPIIDLFCTIGLAATLLTCWLVRKFRRNPSPRATLAIGWAGMLLVVGYLAAGRVLHNRAIFRTLPLVGNERVLRADAYPAMGSIFLWRVVIETNEDWLAVRVHHFSSASPNEWKSRRAARCPENEWIALARGLPEYETYRWFSRGRLRAEYEKIDGLHVVRFHDMRYARDNAGVDSLWPLVAEFDAAGGILFVGRRAERSRGEFGEHAATVWHDLWNP